MKIVLDTAVKHVGSIATSVALAVIASIWAVFVRPQLVMASDLATVAEEVQNVNKKVDQLSDAVNALAVAQIGAHIDYLQDRIRELTVKERDSRLTPDEAYRLSEYRDRLEKAKLSRDSIRVTH